MAAAMSKPLHKQPGKPSGGKPPAMAADGVPIDVKPRDRKVGSATGTMQAAAGAEQDAAARLPGGFLREDAEPRAAPKPKPQAAPKAKPEPPAKQPRMAAKGGGFAVQVGAYKSRKSAERRWDSIMESAKDHLGDLPREVVEGAAADGNGTVFRLRAGPLPDRAAGMELCAKLKNVGVGCFVVTVPKGSSAAAPEADGKADASDSSHAPKAGKAS
jgi:cell division septation protein DedD